MEPDENEGVYGDSGNEGSQPTIEGTAPEGYGALSGSDAGGNKRDPVSSSPTIGDTIAGRTINTGAAGDISNTGRTSGQHLPADEMDDEARTGEPNAGATGVTGTSGKSATSAHDTPDSLASSGDTDSP